MRLNLLRFQSALRSLCISVLLTAPGWCQHVPHYTSKQLRSMMREAKSPEQYRNLADYFGHQEAYLKKMARAEDEEYKRSLGNATESGKYPSRADSALRLRQYYYYEAGVAAKFHELYVEKKKVSSTVNVHSRSYSETEKELIKRIEALEQELKSLKPPGSDNGQPPMA